MNKLFLKPVSGLVVVDPATGAPLPGAGAEVCRNAYWLRRLKDKSVELAGAENPAPSAFCAGDSAVADAALSASGDPKKKAGQKKNKESDGGE